MTSPTDPPRSLFVVWSAAKGPRCYIEKGAAEIDAEHYAPPAAVVEYVPRPDDVFVRLGRWLADSKHGPWRAWARNTVGERIVVFLTDKSGPTRYGVTEEGEGPTLESALSAALDKAEGKRP